MSFEDKLNPITMDALLSQRGVSYLVKELPGDVYIFGGALRDIILGDQEPKDIDVVVECPEPVLDKYMLSLDNCRIERNSFGGFRIWANGSNPVHDLDIWPIGQTAAFKNKSVVYNGPESLLETVYFATDAIMYQLYTGRVLAHKAFVEAIETRRIHIIHPLSSNKDMQHKAAALRARGFEVCLGDSRSSSLVP